MTGARSGHFDAEMRRLVREYGGERVIDLPRPGLGCTSLTTALLQRKSTRRFTGRTLTTAELGTLLGLAAGASDDPPVPLADLGPPGRRTYPSGGGLYPIELLVYPLAIAGLERGYCRYQVLGHRLVRFAAMDEAGAVDAVLDRNGVDLPSVLICLFVDFDGPSFGKYGEKAYRLALLEAGHVAQNLLLVAAALGLAGVPLCGFDDELSSRCAGLAFPREAIVYAIAIGEARVD